MEEKEAKTVVHDDSTVESAENGSEPRYSKLSVWLMLIFMSIATGSDG